LPFEASLSFHQLLIFHFRSFQLIRQFCFVCSNALSLGAGSEGGARGECFAGGGGRASASASATAPSAAATSAAASSAWKAADRLAAAPFAFSAATGFDVASCFLRLLIVWL
jgi:hypothetical protein